MLLFFLAKFLDPASVGYYGIFSATVGYTLFLVGLDFYTYSSREILGTPPHLRGQKLKGHIALCGILYIALAPFAAFFLPRAEWPDNLAIWFLPILVLEHLNQELYRLLISLSDQLVSSLILFVRQGSWAIILVMLMASNTGMRDLQTLTTLWATAGLAAAALGIWRLNRMRLGGWNESIDWLWVRKGISVSIAFLIATLALRGLQTIDRYWIEALGGIELVGAYVLLLGVASTLLVFLDAGVFAYTYPSLIKHDQQQERHAARAKVLKMLRQTAIISLLFGLLSSLALPHLLTWIGNPIYLEAAHWYPWLLAAMIINALSMVPHYALYAQGKDKPIIFSHVGAVICFVSVTAMASQHINELAVPAGLIAAFAFILVWKAAAYWHIENTSRHDDSPRHHH